MQCLQKCLRIPGWQQAPQEQSDGDEEAGHALARLCQASQGDGRPKLPALACCLRDADCLPGRSLQQPGYRGFPSRPRCLPGCGRSRPTWARSRPPIDLCQASLPPMPRRVRFSMLAVQLGQLGWPPRYAISVSNVSPVSKPAENCLIPAYLPPLDTPLASKHRRRGNPHWDRNCSATATPVSRRHERVGFASIMITRRCPTIKRTPFDRGAEALRACW